MGNAKHDSLLGEILSSIHIPVWAFHGAKDGAVPVAFSRDMIDAIQAAGENPRYTEFPDVGHYSWPLAYDTPDLLDWLFAQTRLISDKKPELQRDYIRQHHQELCRIALPITVGSP